MKEVKNTGGGMYRGVKIPVKVLDYVILTGISALIIMFLICIK